MKKLIPILLLFNWQAMQAATFNSNVTNGNWSNAATWILTSGSDPDGIPDADDDVTILSGHTVTLNNAQACINLTVQGTLTASTGGNLSQSGTTTISGTLNLSGGVLDFSQVFALTGTASFNSGNYTFSAGGFSGTGTVTVASGTVTFNTGSGLADNLTVSGGVFQGTLSPAIVNLTLGSGSIFDPGGNANVSGTFTWTGGNIGTSGGTAGTVDVAGAANISSTLNRSFYKKTLNLNGGGSWTGGNIITSSSPTLHLPAGQALTFNSASNLSFGSSGTVNLAGTLTKQGGGTLTVNAALNNSGTIDLQQGTLDLNGTFTQSGTVKGTGTLDVASTSLSNTGIFAPGSSPGLLSLTGNFSNHGGSLDIEIGGTAAWHGIRPIGNHWDGHTQRNRHYQPEFGKRLHTTGRAQFHHSGCGVHERDFCHTHRPFRFRGVQLGHRLQQRTGHYHPVGAVLAARRTS